MEMRGELKRLERRAALQNRQLMAVIEKGEAGEYLCLSSVSREFEILSPEELEALRSKYGRELLEVYLPPEPEK